MRTLVSAVVLGLRHSSVALATVGGPVLARVLGRPAVVPVPAAALRLLLGDLADELLLASTRVVPLRLKETGYEFRHPELEGALRHVLGR